MLELKLPVPLPSVVLVVSAAVGPGDVLQQTPRTVTDEPPSLLILPPLCADVFVIKLSAEVLIWATLSVVKLNSAPYAVPTPLVAYART